MIRLRLLQAAPLLLLLLLQIASVEGLLNLTGCDLTKACWVGEQCAAVHDEEKNAKTFYLLKRKEDFDKLDKTRECSKYLIVEPGTDHFIFEIMHDSFKSSDEITLNFNKLDQKYFVAYFSCKNHEATTPSKGFRVEVEPIAERDHSFCRFRVSKKDSMSTDEEFYAVLKKDFKMGNVAIEHQTGEKPMRILIDDYNEIHFEGRVPCASSIFIEKANEKDHYSKPIHNVRSTEYSCPEKYTMSYATDKQMKLMDMTSKMKCRYGKVEIHVPGTNEVQVKSAQCTRPRNNLCTEVCKDNCTIPKLKKPWFENGQLHFGCETRFMILNENKITKLNAMCSDKSSPESPLWEVKKDFTPNPISTVKCVDELDCNDITPFDDATCQNCKSVSKENGGIKCDSGYHMIMIDKTLNAQHNVTITCNKLTGEWKLDCENAKVCKDLKGTQKEMAKWKLGCEGPKEREKEKEDDKPVAAASSSLLYVGITLGALLLILLFILLLYYICCRKGRKEPPPKDESSKPPTPPTQPKTTTESSNVEQAVEPPPPLAPPSTESEPSPFSGKRVQFINMSKEHLREIEPDDPYKEVSARDKTDSERSKPSQMSQVGGTTDAGTVTGRQTEKTNEMSRTVANADDSRSDVSNGRGNTTLGDNSQTGGGGGSNTPTIGDAAKKKKERKGPRVAFRERVSYETDPTKTRDKSSVASMHTAPEQPWPAVDITQPEGNSVEGKRKDDPSRLNADSARKAFGTRTTQNTKESNDQSSVAGNRSASRVTDISRTG